MYQGLIAAIAIIVVFFCIKAIVKNFVSAEIISVKACFMVVLGAALGCLISTRLFEVSRTAGYVGIGLGLAIMWILFYSGLFGWIFKHLPSIIKKIFRTIGKLGVKALIILAIIVGVIVVLRFIGV